MILTVNYLLLIDNSGPAIFIAVASKRQGKSIHCQLDHYANVFVKLNDKADLLILNVVHIPTKLPTVA